jgi:hypothetical protein
MRGIVVVMGAWILWTTAASGETYVVEPDGSGDYATIQEAVDAAGGGDVIELADGTFTGDGNRDIDFLGKAIAIRSQSGDPTACILHCGGGPDEPHRGCYFHSGEDSRTSIEGVTITGGYAPLEGTQRAGGAIRCSEGVSPVVADCIFLRNDADTGGGVFCANASPTLINCQFIENVASMGGGGLISCWESFPDVHGCTFLGNSGSGVYT